MNYNICNDNELHCEALKTSRELRNAETKLIELIGLINEKKIFLKFGATNIYSYAEKYFGFKYNKVWDFLELYKANIPELKEAILKGDVGYTMLRTVLPALKVKNEAGNSNEVKELLEKTKTTTRQNLEKIVRDMVPLKEAFTPAPKPKYLGSGKIERIARLTREQEVFIDKAINLLSEELGERVTFENFLETVSKRFIEHKLKAGKKRAQIIIDKDTVTTKSMGELKIDKAKIERQLENKHISAAVKKEVVLKYANQCAHCGKTANLHFHHLKPKADGGSDETINLILVCGACHVLLHLQKIKITFADEKPVFIYQDTNIKSYNDLIFEEKRVAYLQTRRVLQKESESQILLF